MDIQLARIQELASFEALRVTQHAQKEMDEEDITLDDILAAIENGQILEDYAEHKRGSCCLLGGYGKNTQPIHIVCTTGLPILVIITVYIPKPPKWINPMQRRPK